MSVPNASGQVEQTIIDKLSMMPVNDQTILGNKINHVHKSDSGVWIDSEDDKLSTSSKTTQNAPYTILEEPNRIGRPIRVITIGAGASALNFAHDISTSPLDISLVMYEKNEEIGGTWFENKYPGAACDIPSVNYQLSWAPSAHWSS